jgi:MarR family transcriptional regulator, 2-MHQ and catechol-resistance regulon repressor
MNDATRTPARKSPPKPATRDAAEASALRLWVILSRAHSAVARHAEADVARHGLTIAEFGVLEALYHVGPMLLGELQRKVLVSSGGVTWLVDRLEKRELVKREACPEDRRARYATLTSEGKKLLARIFPDHARAIERAMSGLTRADRERAAALLRSLGRAAEALPVSPDVE